MHEIKTIWDEWHLGQALTNIDLPAFNMGRNVIRNMNLSKSYASLIFLKQLKQNEETL